MNPQSPSDPEVQRARALAEEAFQLVQKAKKSRGSSGFWSSLVGKNDDDESPEDLFQRAGKLYTEAKQYEEAGRAFEAAAEAQETGKSGKKKTDSLAQRESARTRLEAFKVYKRVSIEEAMRCANVALEALRLHGDASSFARAAEDVAKFLEESDDRKGAIALYGEMGRRYEETGKFDSTAARQFEKEAELLALEGDYYGAVASYEKAADLRLQTSGASTAKKLWFKGGLCALATGDLVTAQRNVQTYIGKDPSWEGDRDYRLLSDLIEAIGAGDQQAFLQKVYAYDQMTKLPAWETAVLAKIKNQIEEADNEFA